ncbi:MAG TPA: aminotransferase class V-fold PLP-dependent enzyme [Candidatus Dormibacteraeota bacterium]|nr:aminotransferase class V-fold PLP-dependent enzyme [Candidatus Dormibacteraeota bacterium]
MPSEHARHWALDPAVDFLNHGSFGATPRVVLAAQQTMRDRLEAEPVRFMVTEFEPALDAARAALGAFVGADPDDLAFVSNATTGVNTVLRSLRFAPGDELLTTDHEYNAVKNAMEYVAERDGARVVVASVPFPIGSPDEVVEAVLSCVSPHTRLTVIDHVTSPTALVLPVERLVAELAGRGVDTLVDGAHAPGMLDLQVAELGAAYYAGNLHKWVCAAKGAGFLWVRRDRQAAIRPLTISHGANSPRTDISRFRLEFDWTGTSDPTAWLTVPDAIRFGEELMDGGWSALRANNRALAMAARHVICEALGVPPPAPDAMLGSMASIPLPWERTPGFVQGVSLYGDAVHGALLEAGFQTMITPWPQRPEAGPWRRVLRLSAAPYNDLAQFERLAAVLPGVVAAAAA